MKKILSGLFLSLLIASTVSAQSFDFEMTRTAETPGFFMVRIFPGSKNSPLPIQDVFVENYSSGESKNYTELIPFINETGGEIINKEELEEYALSKYNRIVTLGEPIDDYLNFKVKDKTQILEEFEEFTNLNLSPIFLQDIEAKFGGNVSEVFPKKLDSIGLDPVYFIGKFERPMKTRMEIKGISSEGEIQASAPLDLKDAELAQGALAQELPDMWEQWWELENEEASRFNISLVDIFPALLLVLAVIVIFFAVKQAKKGQYFEDQIEEIIQKNKLSTPNLQTDTAPPADPAPPLSPFENWDTDLPFEVEKKN
ncbi:hypothetical protein K9M41_01485 [Candidatus Gracilibacteria bacterium]|nr:hypothetical protein [Candidatus Gracilibacteria bacterium]